MTDYQQAIAAIHAAASGIGKRINRTAAARLQSEHRAAIMHNNPLNTDTLQFRHIGPYVVELALSDWTGMRGGSYMCGITVWPGDESELVALDAIRAKLESLARPVQYQRGLSDYAAIRYAADHPEQIAAQVTMDEYEDMLGAVPPIYVKGVPGFLMGEALTGTVYANYFMSRDGLPCARYYRLEQVA